MNNPLLLILVRGKRERIRDEFVDGHHESYDIERLRNEYLRRLWKPEAFKQVFGEERFKEVFVN
ncbi:MAG: hypothetical protein KGJ89_02940 [Patescibacteria group bacterium]|nr:hypothetical protein [Patescibacteria group bacterium]MDE2015494.1 hypothetical protein [Patescibacteria group bacterium]MDE2226890.1 hypothetical protein [Patescibacteria group bacterium]